RRRPARVRRRAPLRARAGPSRRARTGPETPRGRRSPAGERGSRGMRRCSGRQPGGDSAAMCPRVLLLAVLPALPLAVPAAQTWNSPAAVDLAQRAIARRTRAAADTTLRDYKAQAHGFLFFLGQFGEGLADPPRLVKADQLELEVYWKAPASSKIGRAHV